MKKLIVILGTVLLLSMVPYFCLAGSITPIIRIGEEYTVAADKIVSSPIYVIGKDINVNGTLKNDACSVGGDINVNGTVEGNLTSIGGTITINGKVNGNISVVGGGVLVKKDSFIKGSINLINGSIVQEGVATIQGGITQKKIIDLITFLKISQLEKLATWKNRFLFTFSWFLLAILIVALFPKGTDKVSRVIAVKFGTSILWGLFILILTPVLIAILIATGIGIPIAVFVPLFLSLCIFYGTAAFALLLGKKILIAFGVDTPRNIWSEILGMIIILFLFQLPTLGLISKIIVALTGLGAVIKSKLGLIKSVTEVEKI